MHLALKPAKIAKGEFLCAAIEETQHLIKIPLDEFHKEKNQGSEFAVHNNVKAVMVRHPAMLWENQMDGCLPCQTGTAFNRHAHWRPRGTGAPPPDQITHPTP
jgi:hypothetical protein